MRRISSDDDKPWREYYALRNRARLTLVAIPIALILVVGGIRKTPLIDRLNDLPSGVELTVVFAGIGAAGVISAAPILKWVEWRCPRCGNKFVQPKLQFGTYYLLMLIGWYLVLGWRCANCKLACGADSRELHH